MIIIIMLSEFKFKLWEDCYVRRSFLDVRPLTDSTSTTSTTEASTERSPDAVGTDERRKADAGERDRYRVRITCSIHIHLKELES